MEELRIEVEKLNGSLRNTNSKLNHCLSDGVAIEQEESYGTFLD